MASVRPAAVAGMFYPREARVLDAELEDLLGGVAQGAPRLGFPKALVVPHAGYIYSGSVAAHAYDALGPARDIVRRVVLLGPVHRVPVRGLAVPTCEAFETPLGRVPLDRAALQAVQALPQVVKSDAAHALEHSLEVQLPFLQRVLGEFSFVPFVVGMASVDEVAQVLERLWSGAETVVVISTDLSHYHAYEQARRIDGQTLARIASYACDIDHEEACGATPLNGLLAVAKKKNMAIKLLAAGNSGDTAGGKGQVVGYSAFGLYEDGEVSLDAAGSVLVGIARGAIESRLLGAGHEITEAAWLNQAGASFVTLKKSGALRGCIGSLDALRALKADVAENAVGAAFRDPRFPALVPAEWPQCSVEVSLLSRPKPLRFADEADLLEQVVAGEDGLILEAQGRRATFLPQVWESVPDPRAFLHELIRKAGLPADAQLARCRISRYRVVKFDER
ncbi:MAG: AmmeMemoRadiSam system protein B [Betaproteobacteria bacterium]|nr:MAG: AmmeMemoRadiSam system protein B [Betaproteobacteria bacterium]